MLMHLAVNAPNLVTIAEVAERYDISKNHLMKVAHTLVQDGSVTSVRGRNGGLRLARPASAINIGQVTRALEQKSALVDCFPGGHGACLIAPACRLKGALAEALEAFYAVLDRYCLADLVSKNHALEALLEMDVTA